MPSCFRCIGATLLAALVVAVPSAEAASRHLAGPGYRVARPAGLRLLHANGLFQFELTSGPRLDTVSIPRRRGFGLSLGTRTKAKLRHDLHRSLPRTVTGLALAIVGVPRVARHVRRTQAPHAIRLDGAPAVRFAFAYRYHGRHLTQHDVVARHGKRVALIELDADRSRGRAGGAAFHRLLRSWRWR
jgi:hypothetical protein